MADKWYRLDTAALIFPAISRRDWCNVFRMSVTLKDEIDPEILQKAVDDLRHRFPSIYVSLHSGAFWYYLEQSVKPPRVRLDYSYPLTFMGQNELKENGTRILYYKNRIAVEFYHAITDGRGGLSYLCTLAARYLELRYGAHIPPCDPVLDFGEDPHPEELEDSFLKHTAPVPGDRRESTAYRLHGEKEPGGYKHLVTGVVDSDVLHGAAREKGVSVTVYLSAVMAKCIIAMQNAETPRKRQKPVKITLPVDLRRIYGSRTLRNFTLVLNLGVDTRLGDYTLDELCRTISHQLYAHATPQHMSGQISANVTPQKIPILQVTPIFLKNFVMDLVYRDIGERKGCINISNLGVVELPPEMMQYLSRLEFIIGTQRSYPNNCSVISCGGKTYINMIRNIRSAELERLFFSELVQLGIPVDLEYSGQ